MFNSRIYNMIDEAHKYPEILVAIKRAPERFRP
jgi:hypothetical protein